MTQAPLPLTADEYGATFSADRLYRYVLWRTWRQPVARTLNVVGLNPSTADEQVNDPTIRRCLGYARAWGYDRLVVTNLFAWRSPDPGTLRDASEAGGDPVGWGDANDIALYEQAQRATLVLAAWGAHGALYDRATAVAVLLEALGPLYCLGVTKSGQPKHPLYLRADLTPREWRAP